jgi:hypothetical protein
MDTIEEVEEERQGKEYSERHRLKSALVYLKLRTVLIRRVSWLQNDSS